MATAVICEFNPFHNGHKYLLEQARAKTGGPLIAIMSGSFTQRGEAAVCSKFERAETALKNGADLVVELPTVYAVAAARRFAQGGVSIAKAFGVSTLVFGCETASSRLLAEAAAAMDNPKVNALIAAQMKEGAYFPQAAERAVRREFGDGAAGVLTSPNNILAVEYLRELSGSDILPLPVKRVGTAHDSESTDGCFASASNIRAMLRRGEDASAYLPEAPRDITYPGLLERALLFRFRSMSLADWQALPEVGEGLENRIVAAVRENNSVKEIIEAVKTKRYTHARLRRILCCAALGITEDLQSRRATYARVLGFTAEGEKLMKNCAFEVVTSPAKLMKSDSENRAFLQKDILATDLAALAYNPVKPCALDYHTKIIRSNRA